MKQRIKIAFASGPDDLNRELIDRLGAIFPELPLYVVSEFPPHRGEWIPYHVRRGFFENFAAIRAAVNHRRIRLAAVLLVPQMPYRRMRLIALLLAPLGFVAFNEQMDSWMFRPKCLPAIGEHALWRTKNLLRWQFRQRWRIFQWLRQMYRRHSCLPSRDFSRLLFSPGDKTRGSPSSEHKRRDESRLGRHECLRYGVGVSVIIPSRNGLSLLEQMLPALTRELAGMDTQIIIVDNGSDDGTGAWLSQHYPTVEVLPTAEPLSFARAINLGLQRVQLSRTCLLNNDMLLAPGFFPPLLRAFDHIPDLFCATAQIFFPPGIRREETGKSVLRIERAEDFPVRCDDPLPGEDSTYVLYGSGGCSLFDTEKLRALNGLSEIYVPAYVEDLDLGYRGWLHGWPTVFVAASKVEHRHRATTARYYSSDDLAAFTEINYLRFLMNAVQSRKVFRMLWRHAIDRLEILASRGEKPAIRTLENLRTVKREQRPVRPAIPEEQFLALTSGNVAGFPGRERSGKPVVLVASPYLPFPLSHGGAVRMFNLMSRASAEYDQVLVCFCDELATPPRELLDICIDIVLVRREGSHLRKSSGRPDTVEEFDLPAFHAALRQTMRKWSPAIAQLEFTQMAQYAADCSPARTILVEHDITFDLQEQLLRNSRGNPGQEWELRHQLKRWRRFETAVWRAVDCVVTMSEKDRQAAGGSRRAVCLPNGVDTDRFQPAPELPQTARLLFIGSFAHLPNLLAMEFFLKRVWPALGEISPDLHVIAGSRHEYFVAYYSNLASPDFTQPGIEIEGFVADVRPAYRRAEIVIAPLVASAGTNIKILEAMAMGKAIVSTPAGVNGLSIQPGEDAIVTESAEEMAAAILRLSRDSAERQRIERNARETAVQNYDWRKIAQLQKSLYESLEK